MGFQGLRLVLTLGTVLAGSSAANAGPPVGRAHSAPLLGAVHFVAGKPKLPTITDACKRATSWDAAEIVDEEKPKTCIEERERILFREEKTIVEKRGTEIISRTTKQSVPYSAFLPSLPATTFTLEQEEALGKERAIRALENQDRLDVQQDLRDEIRELRNAQ